jgi:hypothetical protein
MPTSLSSQSYSRFSASNSNSLLKSEKRRNEGLRRSCVEPWYEKKYQRNEETTSTAITLSEDLIQKERCPNALLIKRHGMETYGRVEVRR